MKFLGARVPLKLYYIHAVCFMLDIFYRFYMNYGYYFHASSKPVGQELYLGISPRSVDTKVNIVYNTQLVRSFMYK